MKIINVKYFDPDKPIPIKWADATPAMLTRVLGRRHQRNRCLSCGKIIPPEVQTAAWWREWWDQGPYHPGCPLHPMVRPSPHQGQGTGKKKKRKGKKNA